MEEWRIFKSIQFDKKEDLEQFIQKEWKQPQIDCRNDIYFILPDQDFSDFGLKLRNAKLTKKLNLKSKKLELKQMFKQQQGYENWSKIIAVKLDEKINADNKSQMTVAQNLMAQALLLPHNERLSQFVNSFTEAAQKGTIKMILLEKYQNKFNGLEECLINISDLGKQIKQTYITCSFEEQEITPDKELIYLQNWSKTYGSFQGCFIGSYPGFIRKVLLEL